jgi:hypothetical protein
VIILIRTAGFRFFIKNDRNAGEKMANCSGKPRILLLGTFHMGPTTDLFSAKMDNLLSSKRQEEIRDVVQRLKAFRPTKLAVEAQKKHGDAMNSKYRQYVSGDYELKVNEIDQIGFRIAAGLEHPQIYCIDWMEGGGKRGAGDVYEWAQQQKPELFEFVYGWLSREYEDQNQEYKTILEMYRDCNKPSNIKQHHTMYINSARIGEGEDFVGVDWLVWWYQRNLIMFSNLAQLATSSEDRILLIVGGAHVQILSQFLNESGLVELESIHDYL